MNKRKTVLIIGMFLVSLLLALSFIACAGPSPSPSPSPKPTASPSPTASPTPTAPSPTATTPASPVKAIELRFSSFSPPTSPISGIHKRWADMVEQQSGGRLKIKMYFAESLAKQAETFRATQTGVCDIGYYTIATDPGLMPLNQITGLPLIGMPSQAATGPIHQELLKKFPEMAKEFQGLQVIAMSGVPPEQFMFTKKAVRVPADMKGMKFIARGEWPLVMKNIGAVALDLGAGDWYMSLDRGLADGHVINFVAARSFKTLDLLKYHTIFGEGGSTQVIQMNIVNPDTWKNLPADLQKILLDTGKWLDDEIVKSNTTDIQTAINEAKAANHTFINLTPEEIQLWTDAAKPVYDKYVTNNASRGPAQAIFDETKRLIKQYTK